MELLSPLDPLRQSQNHRCRRSGGPLSEPERSRVLSSAWHGPVWFVHLRGVQ